ncbi:hypothetical protein Lesp02_17460 [Lentzea sp. NBRC 105346]|uniref:FtsX-like permease family protein n=1 Tax=Lentzea sp. NBRC 105346 TaxID=3032205 RepID=UPI0024A5C0B9|nr:FtsX-like permease family protein [Lentzea sp. NBRC 105346]GLZ29556.1 hypothetical protein Lesp02_17460 [Lentzea sp. NBRC 105346]
MTRRWGQNLFPVVSIMIAAFFAYGTVLAKEITVRSLNNIKPTQLHEVFALLGAFVVVAMIAAALVSTSTFRIVFAQRMRKLALLRAIGAGRLTLARKLVAEGARTGLLASIAGVALALAAGQLVPVFGLATPGFPVPEAIGVVAGSFVLTTLAVLAPAFNAAKVSPLEALRTSAVQDTKSAIGWPRWALGLALAGGAAFMVRKVIIEGFADRIRPPGLTEELLLSTVVSAALAFGALICLGPALIGPLLRGFSLPLRRLGPVGGLAISGVGGAPRRAASITTVVALGVALVIGSMVGAETMRSLGKAEMASAYPADLEITGPVEPRSGLTDVLPYRRIEVKLDNGVQPMIMRVSDLNLRGLRDLADFRFDGNLQDMGPGKIVLSMKTAERLHLAIGDRIPVKSETGEVTLTVAATAFGGVPLGSSAVLDPSDVDKLGGPKTPDGALANGPLEAAQGLDVESLAAKRAAKENYFFSLFAVAIGLMLLTMLIAVVGVGSTTALSVLERTNESGLLRAIGLSRRGLRRMVTTEAFLYGAIGTVLGLALGIPYAWLGIVSLGVNWPLQIPLAGVALVVVGLGALTVLAGLLPARRASRTSPVAALADV